MTRQWRAATLVIGGAVVWLGTWFTLGATIGIDLGYGYMSKGVQGGVVLGGISLTMLLFVAVAAWAFNATGDSN